MLVNSCVFFFFKQKTAYEMRISDWSSDVCSSDLPVRIIPGLKFALELETHNHKGIILKCVKLLFRSSPLPPSPCRPSSPHSRPNSPPTPSRPNLRLNPRRNRLPSLPRSLPRSPPLNPLPNRRRNLRKHRRATNRRPHRTDKGLTKRKRAGLSHPFLFAYRQHRKKDGWGRE